MAKLRYGLILLTLSILLYSTMIPPSTAKSGPLSSFNFVKTWGTSQIEEGQSVAVDAAGNIYVAGYTTNSTTIGFPAHYAVLLLKYNSTGNLQWERTWGGLYDDLGYGVATDSSGNIYVTGETSSFNHGGTCQGIYNPSGSEPCPDIFLLKFNSTGSLLWQRNLGGNDADVGRGVAVDGSDNIYVAGSSLSLPHSGNAVNHAILLKFNSTGSLLWQRYYGAKIPTTCCTSDPIPGDGVAVDQSSQSVYLLGNYIASHFIMIDKYNSTGGLVWQEAGGNGLACNGGDGIAVDSASHDIYISGTTSCGSGYGLVVKLDSSGNLVWKKYWGSGMYNEGYSIAVSSNGHVFVSGNSQGVGKLGVSILSFDTSGALLSHLQWGYGPGDTGRGVAADSAGNALVAGEVSGPSPYSAVSANTTTGTPVLSMSSGTETSGDPALGVGSPGGAASTPSGVETYGGTLDAFLLSYRPPPVLNIPCLSVICSILSSSLISNPVYTPSNYTLSFTATGDSGTNDSATIIIPKTLVAGQDPANIQFSIHHQPLVHIPSDSNNTDFFVTVTIDFHSPTYVFFYMGPSSASLPTELPIVALLLLVPVVGYRKRSRRPLD